MGDIDGTEVEDARSAAGHAAFGIKGMDDRWIQIQLNTFTNWVNEQLKKVNLSVTDLRTDFSDGVKLCALIELLQQKKIKGVIKKPLNQHQCLENVALALKAMTSDDIKLVNIACTYLEHEHERACVVDEVLRSPGGQDVVNGNLKLVMGLVWRAIIRYQISRGKTSPKKLMLSWVNACIEDYDVNNFTTDWNDGILLHVCAGGDRALVHAHSLTGCEDILSGNEKLTLGVVWRLISRYQMRLTKSRLPPKQLMLSWLHAALPHTRVANFTTDWNSGQALHALLEYCRPGTSPNWKSLNKSEGLRNCRSAMEQAKALFDIPLVVTPENMASPDLDELSGMTYLSYFMKLDSPGYNATLRWVQKQIPQKNIHNFQTDWNDGGALVALINSLGASANTSGAKDAVSVLQTAMNAAKQQLSVEPVITAKEMADKTVDHLGVMAYAAWFQRAALNKARPVVPVATPSVVMQEDLLSASAFPLTRVSQPADLLELSLVHTRFTEMHPVKFSVDALDGSVSKGQVRVEVHGPHTRPSVALEWQGQRAYCEFFPSETGKFKIYAYNGTQMVRGSPREIEVTSPQVNVSRPSSSAFLGTQTPITISATNARLGNVKVEARSPSGQLHDMSISENGGAYTANFTPTEVGDWNISIMYDGKHIQGSPFSVRVFDAAQVKVFGLEGGSVGNMFSFSVDSSGAGEGQLGVSITHNGRQVPAEVKQDGGKGRYRVHFMPDGSGVYAIGVTFAGAEVPGSPYTLEIVDSGNVQASGEGLSVAELNRRARFVVRTGQAGSTRDLRISVTSPRGDFVPCDVTSIGLGTYEAAYTPTEPGEYHIDVSYHGRSVTGSPYRVFVTNNSRISVNNLRPTANLGRPVEFDIDASQGGVGNLEIMINDGQIPCSVQNRGNRQFHATFTPKDPIPHYIQMKFNGQEVAGSPWRVDVVSPQPVMVTGQGVGTVPVNRLSFFDVAAQGMYIDPNQTQVHITGPTMRQVPHQLINAAGGGYSVQYTPTEVGNHTINVSHAGVPAHGSPFVSKAFDSASITVAYPRSAALGGPIEMTVDVTHAGEGQLEITVNRGTLPNSVKMLRKGVFLVTFTPREAKLHTIEIKFNGELLPRGPVEIPVHDTGAVNAYGDGLHQGLVNRESYFRVDAKKSSPAGFDPAQAPLADMTVRVTSPTGRDVPAQVTQVSPGLYGVVYKPTVIGVHKVEIEYCSVPVTGSPFLAKVCDPSGIRVTGIADGTVHQESQFEVDVHDVGEGDMKIAIVSSSEHSVPNVVREHSPGHFAVTYTPTESALHRMNVTFNGVHVPGSPFSCNVSGPTNVKVSGIGLVPCRQPAHFMIVAPDCRLRDISVTITEPRGSPLRSSVRELFPGKFECEWLPVQLGEHTIVVRCRGVEVPGGPFLCGTWDAGLVTVSNIHTGSTGVPSHFTIDASQAGLGNLEIVVSTGDENVPNFVKNIGPGRFDVSFTPQVAESHVISVRFNGENVPGSPFSMDMEGMVGRVRSLGNGLLCVPISRPSVVQIENSRPIDYDEGKAGKPVVEVTAPSNRVIKAVAECYGGVVLKAEFTPREVGPHCIHVTASDGKKVKGSPFACEVYDVSRVVVSPRTSAVVGKQYELDVDTTAAGCGRLDARVTVDNRLVSIRCMERERGMYRISLLPSQPSRHWLYMTFNKDTVPGSPFAFDVDDTCLVVARGHALTAARVNYVAEWDIDVSQAPFDAQPAVRITGPHPRQDTVPADIIAVGENRVDGWLVKWTPRRLGVYTIDVWYGDIPIAGSPFRCKVHDPDKVIVTQEGGGYASSVSNDNDDEVSFFVDASEAGAGNLEVHVQCAKTSVRVPNYVEATARKGCFCIRFAPHPDCYRYLLDVRFNGDPVPGSPFTCVMIDGSKVSAAGPGLASPSTGRNTSFTVNTKGIGNAKLEASVRAPSGTVVPSRVTGSHTTGFVVSYLPAEIGEHVVSVEYADTHIKGSPFNVLVRDARGNRRDSDSSSASGARSPPVAMPSVPVLVSVSNKNGDDIMQPSSAAAPSAMPASLTPLHYSQPPPALAAADFDLRLVSAVVSAPNGTLVPAKIVQQPDGDYKVEYSSKYTGRHKVEILYNGQPIMGSPFFVEIYDPNKIRIEGKKNGSVGQPMEFDVILTDAGQAELVLTVTSPSSHSVPFNIAPTAVGKHITYVPQEAGPHYIHITYGGLEVPGLPLTQMIVGQGQAVPYQPVVAQQAISTSAAPPQGSSVRLHGEGLCKATVGQTAQFVVDSKGNRGDVHILVEGPNSILKNRIDQDHGAVGRYIVTYMPVEVGLHRITVKWQNTPVDGSPYEVRVVDPRKVSVAGGWSSMLDASRRVNLTVNETKRIDFLTRDAGPGELTAVVTDPHSSLLNVKVERTVDNNRQSIEFTPRIEGDYSIMLLYSDVPLPDMPLSGVARSATMAVNHDRVVLTGPGLRDARTREINEFVVDGTEAGNGELQVTMSGMKDDINVDVIPLGDNKYRCSYVPLNAGGYLMNITWSGHPVRGSPFKVNVVSPGEANKVTFAYDTLASSGVGKEVSCIVDTRRAGPGELTASCSGPFKPATCELKDRQDGTFVLVLVPVETGKHIVNVKYGGDHVPGSPMVLQVGGAADPTKVKVYGTGIEDGLLAMFQSHFVCDTRGAGAGQLTVRIRGPKGAFRVEMQRETQKDRVIHCRYDPTEIGEYEVSVKWSGIDVPGSPFYVHIFDTKEELERFFIRNPSRRTRPIAVPNLATNGGGALANGGMFYAEEE